MGCIFSSSSSSSTTELINTDLNQSESVVQSEPVVSFFDSTEKQDEEMESSTLNNDGMKYSDVTLLVGGKVMKAHKNILVKSSPAFAEMFEHDIKGDRFEIPDVVNPEVFEEILKYIYTGAMPQMDKFDYERLLELAILAHEYARELGVAMMPILEEWMTDFIVKLADSCIPSDEPNASEMKEQILDNVRNAPEPSESDIENMKMQMFGTYCAYFG